MRRVFLRDVAELILRGHRSTLLERRGVPLHGDVLDQRLKSGHRLAFITRATLLRDPRRKQRGEVERLLGNFACIFNRELPCAILPRFQLLAFPPLILRKYIRNPSALRACFAHS